MQDTFDTNCSTQGDISPMLPRDIYNSPLSNYVTAPTPGFGQIEACLIHMWQFAGIKIQNCLSQKILISVTENTYSNFNVYMVTQVGAGLGQYRQKLRAIGKAGGSVNPQSHITIYSI